MHPLAPERRAQFEMIAIDGCESAALAGCLMQSRLDDGRRIVDVPSSQRAFAKTESGDKTLVLAEGQTVRLADIVEITFLSPTV